MLNIDVLSKVLVIVILDLTVGVIIIVGIIDKRWMFLDEAKSACAIDKLVRVLLLRMYIAHSCLWRLLLFLQQRLLGLVKQLFLFLKSCSNLGFIFGNVSCLLRHVLVVERCNIEMRLQI